MVVCGVYPAVINLNLERGIVWNALDRRNVPSKVVKFLTKRDTKRSSRNFQFEADKLSKTLMSPAAPLENAVRPLLRSSKLSTSGDTLTKQPLLCPSAPLPPFPANEVSFDDTCACSALAMVVLPP